MSRIIELNDSPLRAVINAQGKIAQIIDERGNDMGIPTATVDPLTGVIENLGASGEISLRGVPYWLNVKESNTRVMRRMLARVANGIARDRIGLMGDSTTAAAGAGSSTFGMQGAYAKGYARKLASRLTAMGMPASAKSIIGDQRTTTGVPMSYPLYDPRVTFGTGWAPGIAGTLGGQGFGFTGASPGTLTLTETITNFETYHAQSVSTGNATVTVDGGATLATLNSTGGAVVVKTALSAGSSGSHAIQINAAGNGNMFIPGIVAWDATKTEIDILQCGYFGGMSSNFTPNAIAWDALKMAVSYGISAVFISLGINDVRNGRTVAAYAADMQTIVTALTAAGIEVYIGDFYPDSIKNYVTQKPYIDAAYQIAREAGLPFYSRSSTFGCDYAVGSGLGYYFDSVHMVELGQAVDANWMAKGILALA